LNMSMNESVSVFLAMWSSRVLLAAGWSAALQSD
jgi:hypothetical protein